MATETRRRNLRMFELIVSRLTDAELRTLSGVLEDEQEYRSHSRSRHAQSLETEELDRQLEAEAQQRSTFREEVKRRAPHRNHSAERTQAPAEANRKQSGTRAKAGTGTDG